MAVYVLLWLAMLYKLPVPGKLLLVLGTGAWMLFCHSFGNHVEEWEKETGREHWIHRPDPYPPGTFSKKK